MPPKILLELHYLNFAMLILKKFINLMALLFGFTTLHVEPAKEGMGRGESSFGCAISWKAIPVYSFNMIHAA